MAIAFVAGHFVQGDANAKLRDLMVPGQSGMAGSHDSADAKKAMGPMIESGELCVTDTAPVMMPLESFQVRSVLGFDKQTSALTAKLAGFDKRFQGPGRTGLGLNEFGLPCENSLTATPIDDGMVRLSLEASCAPLTRVDVVQDRLQFAMRSSVTGAMTVDVPALTQTPVFVVQVKDGPLLTAMAKLPQPVGYDRVALQWRGTEHMQLHAFEMGADYDDMGHVWAGNAGGTDRTDGGFMTQLGDPTLTQPLMAEVYSYPQGQRHVDGVVRLTVETEVTAQNCGRDLLAETLQPGADGSINSSEISLSVPGCEAKGEFLVLKNILRDLKIASN